MPPCSRTGCRRASAQLRMPRTATIGKPRRGKAGRASAAWRAKAGSWIRCSGHQSAISRRDAPESCKSLPPQRKGVGNAGCPVHPQPRVRSGSIECTRVFTAVAPEITRHPRTQWFTAYVVISPAIGLCCHRRSRELASANLTPASRRQDHTILPSASGALVRSAISGHRIQPRVRDDRDTPLSGVDGGGCKVICYF